MTTQSLTIPEIEAIRERAEKATPGPWPTKPTGDYKRITIGAGLVEGPNGYEVAEVYSDDCPREVAEANADLIGSCRLTIPALCATALSALQRVEELERQLAEADDYIRGTNNDARIEQDACDRAYARTTGAKP